MARIRRPRGAWLVTLVIAAVLMLVAAIVFTLAQGTRRITANAQALHAADDSLRLATAARAQLGTALLLASIDAETGSDFSDSRGESMAEAQEALEAVNELVARLYEHAPGADPDIAPARSRFVESGAAVLEMLTVGDPSVSGAANEMDADYRRFVELMADERDRQFGTIESSESFMSRLGDIALFVLALMIPLALIVIYLEVVRRQQRQAELEVRLDAERQLGRARDDFVANASHELRTPLTSIYGLGQLLEEDEALSETAREIVGLINSETSDLNRMVEDLLTTARLAAGQLRFEPEHVEVADESEVVVSPFLRAGTDVELDVIPATVNVDRLRQRQILRNLLSNARKYGGPTKWLRGRVEGNWYVWTVADDGDGVPSELEERLFQRFIHQQSFQQAVAGGVGLGLSIVKSLAEGMGGSVRYQRHDGESRFIVRVPLAAPDIAADNVDGAIEAERLRAAMRLRGAA